MPLLLNDVNVIQACKDRGQRSKSFLLLKPENKTNSIKANQAFEQISIDFNRPLLSFSKNKYLLVVVETFSRFPFAYACPDIKSATVIKKLTHLFSIFGFPGYVHSNQGSSFMSFELKSWLHNLGVPTSRTNRYNPAVNGQVERCNRTIWQTVLLAMRSKKTSSDSLGIRIN